MSALAGCRFEMGQEGTGAVQPMSLIALVSGLHYADVAPFVLEAGDYGAKGRLLAEYARAGFEPSYTGTSLFRIREGLYALMANHEYGVSALDAQGITDATLRARRELHLQIRALRGLGGPWRDLHIVTTGQQIGVREGRRIVGRYSVTAKDLAEGARHHDAVCRVTLPVDLHALTRRRGPHTSREGVRSQPYDIPLRALIARDVDGLLMAGRCISGDFLAHSSYRVTGNAVSMGQAAGVTAALAAKGGLLPHKVPWQRVEGELLKMTRGKPLTPPKEDTHSSYV